MTKTIMATSGGINWECFHRFEIIDEKTVREIWSDRFHKFNTNQGAGNHPTATHYVKKHNIPSTRTVELWAKSGRDILKSHTDWCDRENLPHGDFVALRPIDDYKNVVYYALKM